MSHHWQQPVHKFINRRQSTIEKSLIDGIKKVVIDELKESFAEQTSPTIPPEISPKPDRTAKWLVQPTVVHKPIINGNKITIIAQERLEFSNASKFKFISTGVKLDNVNRNGAVLCISSYNSLTITNPVAADFIAFYINILFSFNGYNGPSLIIDAGKPLCVLKFLP